MSGETTDKAGKIARLREQIAGCRRCALHETRTLTVPGEGDPDADIMFFG
ncbi:MAG: hypothetical protein KC897_06050 [Candidatus Omnitrophica bacterium]|nr:hypothetical protein [Candidatus Omnitrophota bacterium]